MLESDILLSGGHRGRVEATGIDIVDASSNVLETIPFAEIASVHRVGTAITLYAHTGGSRVLTAASALDADRLTGSFPSDIPVSFASSPITSGDPVPDVASSLDRTRNTARWITTGCLSVFSLILLCPILFLAFWVSDGVDGGLKDIVETKLVVGESAEVGNLIERYRVTILDVEDNAQSSDSSEQPADGFRFWIAQVHIENTGLLETNDSLFGSPDWYLRPSDGGSLGEWSSFQGFGPVIDDSIILEPSEEIEGVLVFQIPDDQDIGALVLSMGVNSDELVFVAP